MLNCAYLFFSICSNTDESYSSEDYSADYVLFYPTVGIALKSNAAISPCFCPLTGCTSSHGTWDQPSRQMTSLLCSDQTFQMGPLTCLSSGKQVFLPGSAVPARQPRVPTQSSVFILIRLLLSPVTVLFINASFSLDSSPHRLQEVNSMINKRLKDALFSDQWSELCMDTLSPFGYVLVSTELHTVDSFFFYSYPILTIINPVYHVFIYVSHPFRWRPSVCRESCCWFSLNSAIFHSSEACRQRVHAPDSEDIGYVLRIEERCSDFCSQIYHVAKFVCLCENGV